MQPSSRRLVPPVAPPRRRLLYVVGAALLLMLAIWALKPSPYAHVRNLGSHGKAIVAFGDSLTAGYGAGAGEDYPSWLATESGLPIVNAGVSGDTTDSALARLDADVIARDPRIVIVGLGGNDFLRGTDLATTESTLRTIVRKIQASGAMVVLLGFHFPSITANYEAMYARVAKEEGCLLVDDILDGIESNPRLKSDEIHPNGAGYQVMADRIARRLTNLIRKADKARG